MKVGSRLIFTYNLVNLLVKAKQGYAIIGNPSISNRYLHELEVGKLQSKNLSDNDGNNEKLKTNNDEEERRTSK